MPGDKGPLELPISGRGPRLVLGTPKLYEEGEKRNVFLGLLHGNVSYLQYFKDHNIFRFEGDGRFRLYSYGSKVN